MLRIYQLYLWVTLLLVFVAFRVSADEKLKHDSKTYDVVIYGGTSAGVTAALQTVSMGKTPVIVSPTQHIGGMTTNGLGWTDSGEQAVVGGLPRVFYQRVKRHYDHLASWRFEQANEYSRYDAEKDAMWTFEPHVATEILEQWLTDASVTVVRGECLDRRQGVTKTGNRITHIRTQNGRKFVGRMYIDATYEGDLMATAGVAYTVGRESNSKYGEQLNGNQPAQNLYNHRFLKNIDPYVRVGEPNSGLLPRIETGGRGTEGAGDRLVQAYCFRMCMSNHPDNRVAFKKPAAYDPALYELLLRNFDAGDHRLPIHLGMLPNRKTDTNNSGAVSTDFIGHNYDYPEASYTQRERIIQAHLTYQQGLMWTLAYHPRVPQSVRDTMQVWGLAKDEFVDNDNWPRELYIRESRRMVGDYVMTEHDCRGTRPVVDPIGMGSYNMDSHNVRRYVSADGYAKNEGDVQVSPGNPYPISYRAIVPRESEAANLLVPVCLSASHIAYGSIRMEPVFMIIGQSSATAACLAIDETTSVQSLPYQMLRAKLLADNQVLKWKE